MYIIIVIIAGKYTVFFFSTGKASVDAGLARNTIAMATIKYFPSQTFP
jgi:hypothetical protein